MRALRKLVFGETWALPIGIFVAVGIALVLREVAGSADWWEDSGGFVLLAMLAVAFLAGLGFRR
jgi:mannose/fructose/N-acetylgalactosamine-specific phosphotransferase system component IIC